MKYYICTKNGSAINIFKEISSEEYHKWRKCTEQLKYYSMAKHFRDMAIDNGLEAEHYLKGLQNIVDHTAIRKIDATAIAKKANRLMLNFMVSSRTYVDNLAAYSKHIKNGEQFRTQILSVIYNKELVYAFFYHCRNFAAHFSLVFDKMTIQEDKIELECSKEHLLEYEKWKPIDIEYINSCPGDSLPIVECVEHMNVLLMSIYLGFMQCFIADIQDMHNQIMPLMKQYQILNPIFIESESATDFSGANILGLGLDVLKEATDELALLPNININYITPEQILNGELSGVD